MPRCAFLTLADPTGFDIDDELAAEPLARRGWSLASIPWDAPSVDWGGYDLVVIRSPWDYPARSDAFMARLAQIDAQTRLLNPLAMVRWNLDKRYLRALHERHGVPVVPTRWLDRLPQGALPALFSQLGADELVLKPVVGAGASGAFRLDRDGAQRRQAEVERAFCDRALLAQPFVQTVVDEGEYSLIYFRGTFSHALRKTPKPGDYRVQEEHGGALTPISPAPPLRAAAERALGAACAQLAVDPPLYARVDLVRGRGDYWLMECELIEPALYLRLDEGAGERFAAAIDACFA